MDSRHVRVLHVEDDRVYRALVRRHLSEVQDYDFEVLTVDNQHDAVDAFEKGGFDLVLLDYHLAQGNGLNCLRLMRQRDQLAPIIAVSGTATPEIAAELIEEGADDYLGKDGLTRQVLETSVCAALRRARAFRSRRGPRISRH
jgi:DNA-binding response OmpR family regulator